MSKKINLAMMFTLFCSNFVFGQYVSDFQTVYPFNKGLNSTKNYTFTKDISTISTLPGYMLMANSSVATNIALSALKLDINFNVLLTRSYLPSSSSVKSVTLIAKDVIATLNGGYAACGTVSYENVVYAFMAGFDAKATPLWYKEYPGITSLNAVVEVPVISTKVKYIACGTYNNGDNYATGIILGTDPSGFPIWQNNTLSNGKSDKFEYNDIIPINSPSVANYLFASVGNSNTQPYSDKNVVLTMIDVNGIMQYSYLYGLRNDGSTIYDEEGYGLVLSPKGQIIITGRTKCYFVQLPAIKWDDVLMFAVNLNGNPDWVYHYDIPLNNASGEYAQKVLTLNDNLYVSGFYRGYGFADKSSYDAFLFETYLDGTPTQVRIYGDTGEDLFYAQEVNHTKDGIISAGFTSSFIISPSSALTYAPYVVESYKKIQEPCHSLILKLPYEKADLKMSKIDSWGTDTKYLVKELIEIKNPVQEQIICPKTPWLNIDTITIKAETAGQLTAANVKQEIYSNKVIRLYPNPAQNTLFIEGVSANCSYKIYNNNGVLLQQDKLTNASISIKSLPNGLYFISIGNEKKQLILKFVKE